jgi:cytidylate kinase
LGSLRLTFRLTPVTAPPSVIAVKRVVCISHATGSGGREAGRLVAEQLGYRYVDEDIVVLAAVKGGVDLDTLSDAERRKSFLGRVLDDLAGGATGEAWAVLGPMPPVAESSSGDQLRGLIRDAIEETAAEGDAVIVAHAASHAIGGREDVLRVLLTASKDTRAARLRLAEQLDESAAKRAVKQADAARADYLRRFYEVEQELPTHYDLVLNTDHLSVEQAADLVSAAAST